jgi:hypothetical protein
VALVLEELEPEPEEEVFRLLAEAELRAAYAALFAPRVAFL